jgi:hypothetical protein
MRLAALFQLSISLDKIIAPIAGYVTVCSCESLTLLEPYTQLLLGSRGHISWRKRLLISGCMSDLCYNPDYENSGN